MAEMAFDDLTGPTVHRPGTLDEALALLDERGDEAKLLAGGQSLLVLLRLGLVSPDALISLKHIPELATISERPDGGLAIGAMVTQFALTQDERIRGRYPALAEAAAAVASPPVRRLGTLGGNLCHADPTGDPPAALIALGAEVEIAASSGRRRLPVEDLFADYMETILAPHEVLAGVHIPPARAGMGAAYLKHRVRGTDTALVGVGAGLTLADDGETCLEARIGLVGAGVTPIRAHEAEKLLRGRPATETAIEEAAAAAAAECVPFDDTEASEWYRREMVNVFVRRAGRVALERARGTIGRN